MKRYFIILTSAILNICLIACNNSDNNTGNQKTAISQDSTDRPNPCQGIDDIDLCKDAGGIANIAILSTDAQNMMLNFTNIFKKEAGADIRAFEPVYWLDKCVINGIADYLHTRTDPGTGKKFDGIRIYMACELTDNAGYGADPYKRRTSVYIFPTINEAPTGSRTSNHKTIEQKISLTGTCSSSYLQDYSVAQPQYDAFRAIYRKEGTAQLKDSLSKTIWLDSCVVSTLQKLVNLPNANVDGVNINMASYDATIQPSTPVSGRFKQIQTTLILVPTHIVGGVREDYWRIVDCLFNHVKKMNWFPAGLNHGELCPQVCN